MSIDLIFNDGDKFRDAVKDSMMQVATSKITEETLDHVESRDTGGSEVDMARLV